MFASAEWEDDVPIDTVDFTKVKKKRKAKNTEDKSQEAKVNNNKNELQPGNKKPKKTSPAQLEPQNKIRKRNLSPSKFNDDVDEAIISKKKKELYKPIEKTELEEMLFKHDSNSKNKKKETITKMLTTNRTKLAISGNPLRERMIKKLKAAQFRYLNEKLYLSASKDADQLFKNDPESFKVYHDGFRQQVQKWPLNPLDVIVQKISKMPKSTKVADMGCGEGQLAARVPQSVRSFDLVSVSRAVEACDMAHTPLASGEMDVAVYCLALMGTNLKDYLVEANRILKVGGLLKIAEVESRFKDINKFVKDIECYGFSVANVDDSKKLFYFLDFKKVRDLGKKINKLPAIMLDPCLYKKR